jgi:hypothetical protein
MCVKKIYIFLNPKPLMDCPVTGISQGALFLAAFEAKGVDGFLRKIKFVLN